MSEQTKHERFVSEETLEQIANLLEPLSNCLSMPMTLIDSDGKVFCRSTSLSPCSLEPKGDGTEKDACAECYARLRERLKNIYDIPIMEKCESGVEIIAIPIKAERQFPTSIRKQFIGMLCINPLHKSDIASEQNQIHSVLAFVESLLRQISMRNQDLGELVSQLLESQNELNISYRFASAATENMDIDTLFQEALELINNHIGTREACIVVPSGENGFEEVAYKTSGINFGASAQLLGTTGYSKIVSRALSGVPVVMNSYGENSEFDDIDSSVKSVLAMPIRTSQDVFGAIILLGKENGEMFLADDENFVTSLTNSLGMVLKHIKLARELVKAEKSSVEKQRELVARVVHKMRNLLFAMKGNIRWINEICDDEHIDQDELEAALGRIDGNFQDASKVISGFLRYVAPDRFQPEHANISSIVSEIVKSVRKELNGKVLIEEEYSQELPEIEIDVSAFRTVVSELIMNADQHLNGDGCISIRTGLASEKELEAAGVTANGQYLTVEVKDNGPGIPDDIRPKIFNLGFSTRSMGTGLGLSLVKRDVERNNGSIVEVGEQGADFLILLPVSERV